MIDALLAYYLPIIERKDGRGVTIGGLPLRYSLMNALL